LLSSEAASLSITIATGVFKLANRLDLIQAERLAVQGDLALPMPPVKGGPSATRMAKDLNGLLDPPGQIDAADRTSLKRALANRPSGATLEKWYGKFWPDRVNAPSLDPDEEFFKRLQEVRPDWNLNDPDTRLAAYHVAAGKDSRARGYEWRIALTVVDVVAEFGAENTALFVRDKKLPPGCCATPSPLR
jgi:hypothetical protein